MKIGKWLPILAFLLCALTQQLLDSAVGGDILIDDLARRGFRYFEDHHDPSTGLVRHRAGNFDVGGSQNAMASIASTGYYLSFLPEAVRLGWIRA